MNIPLLRMVAVGGGSMKDGETLSIDKEIVALCGKARPRALFIPTASGDDAAYADAFARIYGKRLGCRVTPLFLLKNPPPPAERRALIEEADLIYVGGGNTLKMMRRWRHLGVDKLLRTASRRGTTLAGTSAGAICWFAYGHSDSWFYYEGMPKKHIRVRALGLVPATYCPHYHKEKREKLFLRMMARTGGMGLAADNNAAIQILSDRLRVLRSHPRAQAYRVYKKDGRAVSEPLPGGRAFAPLEDVLAD